MRPEEFSMTMTPQIHAPRRGGARRALAALTVACALIAAPSWAAEPEAQAAIARADAKIEMATRQAGVAGNMGDASYNMARQRVDAAKLALKDAKYNSAEMLAEEAALLAELTGEKAKLAALTVSHDTLARSLNRPTIAQ
jgi:hypothetical protein